jgi:hypothetical protein
MAFEPIVTATYRSERSDPRPGQSMYLHLSDLRWNRPFHLRTLTAKHQKSTPNGCRRDGDSIRLCCSSRNASALPFVVNRFNSSTPKPAPSILPSDPPRSIFGNHKVVHASVTVRYRDNFIAEYSQFGSDYAGASLQAFVKLNRQKGYRLVATNAIGTNAFFVRNDIPCDWLPEIDVSTCFDHPRAQFGLTKPESHICRSRKREIPILTVECRSESAR